MALPRLSLTEFAVLGVLAEEPRHGFAVARELESEGDLGRVFTVRRSLVYRALDRLVEVRYAAAVGTEQGEGPKRVVHRVTGSGRRRLNAWLKLPVDHVRDLRIEFLLKVTLIERSGGSPIGLIRAQLEALGPTFDALRSPMPDPEDHVELWRRHNSAAAAGYLRALLSAYEL